MADVFTKNPKLDAFILVGGWAQFGPQAYAQVTDQVMAKLKSKDLIVIAGDTLPPQLDALKAGRSHAQIGQRPFEMGHRAPAVLIDLIGGKKVADPAIHRPRRMHAGQPRQVPGQVAGWRPRSSSSRGSPSTSGRSRR
jgi:ABC-type sugar transport system substrate-binding protein